jgi:hypothetical protein
VSFRLSLQRKQRSLFFWCASELSPWRSLARFFQSLPQRCDFVIGAHVVRLLRAHAMKPRSPHPRTTVTGEDVLPIASIAAWSTAQTARDVDSCANSFTPSLPANRWGLCSAYLLAANLGSAAIAMLRVESRLQSIVDAICG